MAKFPDKAFPFYTNLAVAAYYLHRPLEAQQMLDRALAIKPQHPAPLVVALWLAQQEQPQLIPDRAQVLLQIPFTNLSQADYPYVTEAHNVLMLYYQQTGDTQRWAQQQQEAQRFAQRVAQAQAAQQAALLQQQATIQQTLYSLQSSRHFASQQRTIRDLWAAMVCLAVGMLVVLAFYFYRLRIHRRQLAREARNVPGPVREKIDALARTVAFVFGDEDEEDFQ